MQFVGFSRRSRRFFFAQRRHVVLAMAALLAVSGVSFVATVQPAEAARVSIRLEKSAPATVLVGAPITYSITATNPRDDGDADFQYNLSFRDVLPKGVSYVSTSAPKGLGEPQQIPQVDADGTSTGTVLIWSNVADLPDGSDVTLTYKAQPDADTYRVGEQVTNNATGYASSSERYLAKFDAKGDAVANAAISSAADTVTTTVTALQLDKSEPSSEHELVRGVHDHPTTYSLKVTNNAAAATEDVTVVDYLPAGLEFLGCGGVDNGAGPEYPGAPSLTGTPVISSGAGCLAPVSVTTVDSGLPAGYPAGVYTRVEWKLSDLAPDSTSTIKYAAGIPLRNNVMPAAGFVSTANLDNNTGPSTRETASEIGLTNRATATGRYQGVNRAGETDLAVSATDTVTVTSEDIAVAKSIHDANAFAQGGQVRYDLLVRTSEYTDGSDIVLVDTLPDGLCPADAPASAYTQEALDQAGSGQCAPSGTNTAIESVDFVGGVFVVTFDAFDLVKSGQTTISYKARMRPTYNNGSEQTSAGDSYTNKIALTGTTTPVPATGATGRQGVEDASEATLNSGSPTIDKRILRNTAAPHSCDDTTWTSSSTGNWSDSQAAAGDTPFTPGSRVCFQVRVTFPADTSTRLPVVTDYLPDNLEYEAASFKLVGGVNTVALTDSAAKIEQDLAAGTASLHPGTDVGSQRYVAKGEVLAFQLSAIVQPNDTPDVDVQGNLAKLRWTDHAGRVSSVRDLADFRVPPVPPVTIDKKVATTSPLGAYADTQAVRHGDVVRFKVDVANEGTTPVGAVQVWDVLPAPFTCASVTAVTDGGTCTDPGATGHPTFSGSATASAIRWTLPAAVAAGTTSGVTYDVTVPTGTSVGTTYTNTAHVRSFTTPTNLGGSGVTHYPASNIDTLVLPAVYDAPAADDDASVRLPAVGLTKTNASPVAANNAANQAVPGETVTYAIRATVPARTTVYNGVLADALPTGLTFVSAAAGYSETGANPASDPLPTGTQLDAATGRLTLPPTVTNATDTAHVYEVTITTRVTPAHTGTATLTNTATFGSTTTSSTDSAAVDPVTASSGITPVHPAPALSKALTTPPTQDAMPSAGETRQYVLTASNAAGRPTLYDSQVVDCVPAGLTVTVLPTGASKADAAAEDACAATAGTGTTITWPTGTLAAGQSETLTYTVRVNLDAAGGQAQRHRHRDDRPHGPRRPAHYQEPHRHRHGRPGRDVDARRLQPRTVDVARPDHRQGHAPVRDDVRVGHGSGLGLLPHGRCRDLHPVGRSPGRRADRGRPDHARGQGPGGADGAGREQGDGQRHHPAARHDPGQGQRHRRRDRHADAHRRPVAEEVAEGPRQGRRRLTRDVRARAHQCRSVDRYRRHDHRHAPELPDLRQRWGRRLDVRRRRAAGHL
jgi:uncharacterized repeat protein (TIGR01451 family)/fimbrial isopeptide formation D2 family protein